MLVTGKIEDMIPLTVAQLGDYKKLFEPVISDIIKLSANEHIPIKLKNKVMLEVSHHLSVALAYKSHNDDILKNHSKEEAHIDWKVHEDKILGALNGVKSELETLKAIIGD